MVNANIGFSKAMSLGWLLIDKSATGEPKVYRKVGFINDVINTNMMLTIPLHTCIGM